MTDFFDLEPEQQVEWLAAAGRQALQHWNVHDATLDLIKYRENAVFRVEYDGSRKALRLHRHGYHSDDELRSELQWMRALEDAGIPVPVVIPAESGELFVKQADPGLPGEIQVDLFEWIDGEQLGSVEEGVADEASVESIYATMGELAAMVHNQATIWQPPQGFTRHAWDAEGIAGEQPIWGRFWELESASPSERELMRRVRDRVYQELTSLAKSPGTYSMIHADFAPENLLVDGDRVRLIDFDDAGYGWHLFEIATSLYFIQDEPYYEQAKDALIEGYRRHRQLCDEELAQLPLHFLARGFTYIGWVHTRSETETAQELAPMLLEGACALAEEY
ncbi:MAG: phosphotransferase enzyme family protein, partial [Woeseiaceae bacterium]